MKNIFLMVVGGLVIAACSASTEAEQEEAAQASEAVTACVPLYGVCTAGGAPCCQGEAGTLTIVCKAWSLGRRQCTVQR